MNICEPRRWYNIWEVKPYRGISIDTQETFSYTWPVKKHVLIKLWRFSQPHCLRGDSGHCPFSVHLSWDVSCISIFLNETEQKSYLLIYSKTDENGEFNFTFTVPESVYPGLIHITVKSNRTYIYNEF